MKKFILITIAVILIFVIAYTNIFADQSLLTLQNGNEGGNVIANVPAILQNPELPTGCEATSLTIALNYFGFNVDKLTIAEKYMPKMDFYKKDNVLYGANFIYQFAGNPKSTNGYGCYAPCIVSTATNYFFDISSSATAQDISGTNFEKLFLYIDQNNPVIIWATMNMGETSNGRSWYTPEGAKVTWKNNEHCLVLTGYNLNENTVTIVDPLKGIVQYNLNKVKLRYEQMGSNAVIINK